MLILVLTKCGKITAYSEWVNLRRIWAMLDSRICSSLCQSIHILMNEILILLKTPIKEINMLGFKNRSASSDMRMIFFYARFQLEYRYTSMLHLLDTFWIYLIIKTILLHAFGILTWKGKYRRFFLEKMKYPWFFSVGAVCI
jgi:hypothetical protein